MAVSVKHATNLLVALIRLKDVLPDLVGQEAWKRVGDDFIVQLNQLNRSTTDDELIELAVKLGETIAAFGAARQHLYEEVLALSLLREAVEDRLGETMHADALDSRSTEDAIITLQLLIDLELEDIGEEETRTLTLAPGGLGGGKSVKVENFRINYEEIAEAAAGAVMTGVDIAGKPHPLVISAGILLIIQGILGAITVPITEREASVFWGLLKAQRTSSGVDELSLIKEVNAERARFGLHRLSDGLIIHTLRELEKLKSVELVDGAWRIVEEYKVRD